MWKRANDLSIILIQDNKEQLIIINSVSSSLARILGYNNDQLINRSFFEILSPLSREYVAEGINFSDNDIGMLFSKMTRLTFLTRHTDQIKMIIKAYMINKINDKMEFNVLLESCEVETNLLLLRSNIKSLVKHCGALSDPNKDLITLKYILSATSNYIKSINLQGETILVIIEIVNIIDILLEGKIFSLENIMNIIKNNIREDDFIMKLRENQIALILLNTNSNHIEKTVGRIIKHLISKLDPNTKPVFNIGCCYVSDRQDPEIIIEKCLRSIRKNTFYGNSKLVIHNDL